MKVTPIRSYSQPAFPTRWVLDEHPEILRLVPKRWQTNTVVLSAMAGLYLLMAGSQRVDAKDTKAPEKTRVAPMFQHGAGRGLFGGDMMSPALSLSEAEAREVIVEEAKRSGLIFTPDTPTIPDIVVTYADPVDSKTSISPTLSPLVMDGMNKAKRISYEFVSEEDLSVWDRLSESTLIDRKSKATAEGIRKRLSEKAPPGVYAVFYEPFAIPQVKYIKKGQVDWNDQQAEGKKLCREELRKQVQDFIKWLKAEDVI